MINWGLRNRVLILALLPSIGISILLGAYLSYSRLHDLGEFLDERGITTSQQLAVIFQYALQDDNRQLQQSIANATLEEKGVRAVTLYNKEGQALVHSGPKMLAPQPDEPELLNGQAFRDTLIKRHTTDTVRFATPIRVNNLVSEVSQPENHQANDNLIGWIEVEYTQNAFTVKKYQTILASAALILLALLVTGLFTLKVNHQFVAAVRQLIEGIQRIKNSNFDTPIKLENEDEFSSLGEDINDMASSIKSAFDEMQQNVEQTTGDLRETLETVEIQNIELDLARKEAIEGSRIKSEFLANTSHEIRTPLNGIIGFTNLLLKTKLTTQQRDYLETIQQSSDGLLTIINDILDFSKIEAGKLVLDHVPINLRDLIEETLTMLAPTSNEKGLELILLIYADVPVNIVGDPLRIKQVLTNLVSNAIKFTEHGNIIIRVNLESQQDAQIHLTISITDSGIGLSSKQQRDIFSAFTQADTSTSREFGGTGLGLVISKRLVEQMGGDIGLESEPGKGSTFKFSIKAKLANTDERLSSRELQNKHIILYESNPVLQLSLKHLLESWQIQVHCLENENTINEERLQQIMTRHDIDSAIIGLSHQQLLNNPIKNAQILHQHLNKPMIILTPSIALLSHDQQIPNQNFHFLAKPVPGSKLNKLLRSIFSQQHSTTKMLSSNDKRIHRSQQVKDAPRILAVDDNTANLKLLSVLLSDLGADVTQATSGIEALSKVEQQHFDLIFMDIQMPEMDGITTTERIRALPPDISNTPIIALTAHAMAEERQKLLKAGLNDHLTKPINETQLSQMIQRWCHWAYDVTYDDEEAVAEEVIFSAHYNRPVDLQLCLKLANQKTDLAKDMLEMLLNKLLEDKDAINQAFENRQFTDLQEQVHKLHGATCYTGVPVLKKLTQALEVALKTGNTKEIEHLVSEVSKAIDKLIEWAENHDIDALFFPEQSNALEN